MFFFFLLLFIGSEKYLRSRPNLFLLFADYLTICTSRYMSVYIYILHILYTLQESVTYKIFTNPVSSSRCVVLILVNRRLDIIGSYIVFNSAEEYMACTGRTTMHGLKFSLPLLLFVPGSVAWTDIRIPRFTRRSKPALVS